MRKLLLACACCALVAMIIAGCGGSDSPSTSGASAKVDPNKKVTLTIWDQSSPDPKITAQIDSAYMTAHPNVTVKRVHQPAETYLTLLHSAIAARKGPDIYATFSGRYVKDFVSGTLPLDDLVQPGDIDKVNGWKFSNEMAGGNYVVPVDGSGSVLYYNKALFSQAGLDPEAPPTTWVDFMNACDKLKAAGIVPFAGGFKDGGLAEIIVANWAPQYIPADQALSSVTNPNFKDPAISKAFGLIHQLYSHGCFTPHSDAINLFPDVVNLFKAGKAAMSLGFVSTDLHYKIWRQTAWGKEHLGVMAFPLVPNSLWDKPLVQFVPASAYAITKWTQDPAVAYDYIKFYGNDTNAKRLFDEAGVIPANNHVALSSSDPVAQQILDWIHAKQTQLGGPVSGMTSNAETAFLKYVPQIITGKSSYDDIAGQVQDEQDKATR